MIANSEKIMTKMKKIVWGLKTIEYARKILNKWNLNGKNSENHEATQMYESGNS